MSAPLFENLPINCVVASLTNPRKSFDPVKLHELASSIKASGLHTPVLVRPLPASRLEDTADMKPRPTHELVAGERRFRACQIAGLTHLPAMVREIDDNQVREIQIVENLQRDDLTALEEAEGYAQLMGHSSLTAEQLAVRIGKSRSHVYGRVKLLNLCQEGRQAMRDGWLPATHALLIARMPSSKLQIAALGNMRDYTNELLSYRAAADLVQRQYMLSLTRATFKITDATLVPAAGSCRACPKRTGADPDLFADVKAADTCTDPVCYRKKEEAHAQRAQAAAKEAGLEIIEGREAKQLIPHSWNSRVEGHLRLDSKEDSPTGEPLRKVLAKVMKERGITEVLVANPHKDGELIACLPSGLATELLRAAAGSNEKAAEVVTQLEDQEQRRQKAEAENAKREAKTEYERAWRWSMLEETWQLAQTGAAPTWPALARHLATEMAERLNVDDSKRLCKLLGLGKVAPKSALQDWVRDAPDAHLPLQLLVMFRDVGYWPNHYMGQAVKDPWEANKGLLLVAEEYGVHMADVQDQVKKAVRAAAKAAKAQEAADATAPDGPAAQASGVRGGGDRNETSRGKKPGKRKTPAAAPAMSAEEAIQGIAAAMQGEEGRATAPDQAQTPEMAVAWPFPPSEGRP